MLAEGSFNQRILDISVIKFAGSPQAR